ncbi:MAG: alanine--tRNA ligase [Methylocystaceae bacterium]
MLTGNEIRQKFLDYYAANGHTIVASSSLVPVNDPTLLFANAGMNQFKDVFLGIDQRPYRRATTSQKCVRAGGKHNDLDTVGRTARHHTFFEMLGNFSFGDYFKRDAIRFAWEFLTAELGIKPEKLYITVYQDDDEAEQLWQEVAGVSPDRIIRLGEKDNFWSMGETGPCGPCSEIIYDRGEEHRCNEENCFIGECDCDRWLEIWNLVFMQYNRDENGEMTPLPRPSIDTGMGLERITSVMQGVNSNFDTDLFQPLLGAVEDLTGKTYEAGAAGFPFRVIADHARACSFLIADGVLPANDGRGYVLRRILRRAIRFGKLLGVNEPFLYKMVDTVTDLMGAAFPDLLAKQEFIKRVIRLEEERFLVTLSEGIRKVEDIIARSTDKVINGSDAFMLYDTYGFPLDLTEDMAEENGFTVDKNGFAAMMAEQRERARSAQKGGNAFSHEQQVASLLNGIKGTDFLGYETTAAKGAIKALLGQDEDLDVAGEGEITIVLDRTPFYAESGGQVADMGTITGANGVCMVSEVRKVAGWFLHRGTLAGTLVKGETVSCQVVNDRRIDIACNHTGTHLLHKALRQVIGEHAEQKGSLVEPDRLRFDFSHFAGLSPEEIRQVEDIVNQEIRACRQVSTVVARREEAKELGAMALFGEKYGEVVRVVMVDDFSRELCGGTHVRNTGQIGLFKILSEGSVGAGLRRIEAVTGRGALNYLRQQEELVGQVVEALKTAPPEILNRLEDVNKEYKALERELHQLKGQMAAQESQNVLGQSTDINGVKVLVAQLGETDANTLRQSAERLRDKLGESVVVLGCSEEGKVNFAAFASPSVVKRGLHVGKIVGQAAKIAGGGGGGRPDMAQAGGKDADKLKAALDHARELIDKALA